MRQQGKRTFLLFCEIKRLHVLYCIGNYRWNRRLSLAKTGYANWKGGKPTGKDNRDCVVIRSRRGKWLDIKCSKRRPYVCAVKPGKWKRMVLNQSLLLLHEGLFSLSIETERHKIAAMLGEQRTGRQQGNRHWTENFLITWSEPSLWMIDTEVLKIWHNFLVKVHWESNCLLFRGSEWLVL